MGKGLCVVFRKARTIRGIMISGGLTGSGVFESSSYTAIRVTLLFSDRFVVGSWAIPWMM